MKFSIKNLSHTYAGKVEALRDLSLELQSNSVTALLGPNGAGKSTLFKILAGLVHPTSGQIEINEKLWDRDDASPLGHIGFVFQDPTVDPMRSGQANLIYAAQLQDMLRDTEQRAAEVIATRSDLVDAQKRMSEAEAYFDRFTYYGPWLHRLARLSPDSVYLTRLSLKERQLTISGLADNAANYQSALAEAAVFLELEAPSAFTRDARADAERFTLTMQLKDGDTQ